MPTIFGINIARLLVAIFLVICALTLMLTLGLLLSWAERKQSALMQDRIGANRCYIPLPGGKKLILWGLIHNLADATKMLFKEDFKPKATDKLLYNLAPYLAVICSFTLVAVVPMGGEVKLGQFFNAWYLRWIPALPEYFATHFSDFSFRVQVAPLNIGLLYFLAIGGLGIFAAIIAGWSSNNKFSLFGALRAGAQMISYEVAMGISLLGLVFVYQNVDLWEIVQAQGNLWWGVIPQWGIFVQPFGFLLFFITAIAESKRVPFDLPEAESELVSGYFTEYSAFKMLLFMLSEFVEIAFVATIVTTLFFGGYQIPYLLADGFHFPWGSIWSLSNATVVLLQVGAFTAKVIFFCWFLMLVRWSLPRFRYDQLMQLSWKKILPLAIANFVITVAIVAIGGF
ncbi:NADH-quinone oxidoreductase subunit H [candidate division KSB1 bacterium]|nr:NADH-quinone oxidoreductase subunit H [candidate division KSB1 bacterium]